MMHSKFLLRNLFPDNTSINFIKLSKVTLIASLLLVLFIIVSAYFKPLNYGIDFKGGVLFELKFDSKPNIETIRSDLNGLHMGEFSVQSINDGSEILIKTSVKEGVGLKDYMDAIKHTFASKGVKFEVRKSEIVGAEVGHEAVKKGLMSIGFTLLGIAAYVFYRFNLRYAVSALIGLVYCLVLTFGLLLFTEIEFNLTSVAALLTVLGYSVNDIVVIFDRIRENLRKYTRLKTDELLNLSINETLSRTILTVVTMLIAAGALILFGPEALRGFSIIVFVGVIIGTYSSIFVCAPLMKVLEKKI